MSAAGPARPASDPEAPAPAAPGIVAVGVMAVAYCAGVRSPAGTPRLGDALISAESGAPDWAMLNMLPGIAAAPAPPAAPAACVMAASTAGFMPMAGAEGLIRLGADALGERIEESEPAPCPACVIAWSTAGFMSIVGAEGEIIGGLVAPGSSSESEPAFCAVSSMLPGTFAGDAPPPSRPLAAFVIPESNCGFCASSPSMPAQSLAPPELPPPGPSNGARGPERLYWRCCVCGGVPASR